ncbi:MAG: HigA family addiction module antitoxin [Candidatus Krumholzibacteriaceae bacterium]|jgi:addiction module HigA family antidote
MRKKMMEPVHPGEILFEEFLKPLKMSQNELARRLGVPPRRINEIVLAKRAVTADTALRLARFFNMSPQFWLGLQMDYELDVESDRAGQRIASEVTQYSKAM